MNIENLKRLADHVDALPLTPPDADAGFNMSRYTFECGTPACLAGHAWAMAINYDPNAVASRHDVNTIATEWLDLDDEEADLLFLNTECTLDIARITPQEAATVIRDFIETGEVRWGVAGYSFI